MEKKKWIIELLTAVRDTTNDIEKVADEICSLFNVVGQSEQLKPERQICYKNNEVCKYDCSGLCKESC